MSKGFKTFGVVWVLVSCAPPKLDGGEWNVAVGETLRLFIVGLENALGEMGMVLAGVLMIALLRRYLKERKRTNL